MSKAVKKIGIGDTVVLTDGRAVNILSLDGGKSARLAASTRVQEVHFGKPVNVFDRVTLDSIIGRYENEVVS